MQLKLLSLFLLTFYLIQFISALGVSPAKVEINFEPRATKEFQMGVYNSPAKNQDVEIYVKFTELDSRVVEEFRNIVVLEKEELSFIEQEDKKTLKVSLNFPATMSVSGVHELRVGAIKKVDSEEEGVNVIAGNEIRVLVNVSSQYATGGDLEGIKILKILRVSGEDIVEGNKGNVSVLVKSDSDVELKDVFAEINVSRNENFIKMIETNKINLEPGEENSLIAVLDSKGIVPGPLMLDAEVFYDSQSIKSSGSLNILQSEGGKGFFIYIIIVCIIVFLLLLILFWVFLLLRRKKEEHKETTENFSPEQNVSYE